MWYGLNNNIHKGATRCLPPTFSFYPSLPTHTSSNHHHYGSDMDKLYYALLPLKPFMWNSSINNKLGGSACWLAASVVFYTAFLHSEEAGNGPASHFNSYISKQDLATVLITLNIPDLSPASVSTVCFPWNLSSAFILIVLLFRFGKRKYFAPLLWREGSSLLLLLVTTLFPPPCPLL